MTIFRFSCAVSGLLMLGACSSTQTASNSSTLNNQLSSSTKSSSKNTEVAKIEAVAKAGPSAAAYSYSKEELAAYDAIFTFPNSGPNSGNVKKASSNRSKSTSAYIPQQRPSERLKPLSKLKKPYFIEFRARNALSYGHAFVAFGVLDKNGNVPTDEKGVLTPGLVEISGLHPKSDSTVQYSLGHVLPVAALTGPSDGDTEKIYMLAKHRINLTAEEFDYVVKIVRARKKSGTFWHGPTYACVQYIKGIARDLGVKTSIAFQLPEGMINSIQKLNGDSLPPMRKS